MRKAGAAAAAYFANKDTCEEKAKQELAKDEATDGHDALVKAVEAVETKRVRAVVSFFGKLLLEAHFEDGESLALLERMLRNLPALDADQKKRWTLWYDGRPVGSNSLFDSRMRLLTFGPVSSMRIEMENH